MRHRLQSRPISACLAALTLAAWSPLVTVSRARPLSNASPNVISIALGDGRAWVDDANLESGANLYPGERVRLDGNSNAMLYLPGGFALLAAGTTFRVEAGGLWLDHGKLQLCQNEPSTFAINGALFRAHVGASSHWPARAEFLASASGARITSLAGIVELAPSDDATTYRVHPGESALLGDQVPQAAAATSNPSAGAVTRLLPPVQVDRGAQQLDAELHSPVYWNDLLHSGRSGRARVSLTDGSVLSLGSDSDLRVLQHDAAAQQTVLDLAAGRMRGNIMKLTRPGAKFEIRTPSAVAGLVGTDFYLYVTPDSTELIVFEGVVRLTNSAGQVVNVSAGMKATMRRAGQVEGPSPATPQEVAEAQSSTNVSSRFLAKNWPGVTIVPAMAVAVVIVTLHGPHTNPMSPFRLDLANE